MDGLTRRQMLGGAAAAALIAARTARAQAPAEAAGRVLDDEGGRGLAGVMVSNGADVVLTDADGRWRLPLRPGDSAFVIKPSGWMVPLDPETRVPRFAYVHAPEGTPAVLALRYRGLAPTGALPAEIVFRLRRQREAAAFSAVLLADPQPESLIELDYVRDDVAARIAGVEAAFGITLGDVMFDDLANYDRHNRIIGALGLPWWNLPGNHDINLDAPDDRFSRETFLRHYGARYCAFQYGEATFLLLDNVEFLGPTPNGKGEYRGRFGARQLGFVRNVLANVPPAQPVIACFHMPLRTALGDAASLIATDGHDFLAALGARQNCVSFAGHTHTNEHWYFSSEDGFAGGEHHHHVLAAGSGSWWSGPIDARGIPEALQTDGCPNGFFVLDVEPGRSAARFEPAHDPSAGQIRLGLDAQMHAATREVVHEYRAGALARGPVAVEALGSTRLLANVFDGGPRSRVSVAFDAGAAIPMQRVLRTDPYVAEVYERAYATKKPWVQPNVCTHLWQAALPETLSAGAHRVRVEAVDEHGRSHTSTMILEVTG
jgi:hypothetical protein